MNRLITIAFSHYNEKARWALDRLAIPYREQACLPGMHAAPVALATWRARDARADGTSSRFSTPVLITAEGRRLCDSTHILEWANAHRRRDDVDLYADPAAATLEQRFGDRLGAQTRRVAYDWLLRDPARLQALAEANVGAVQARLNRLVGPRVAAVMRRELVVSDAAVRQAEAEVIAEVTAVSALLGRRRYLVASRFTAADLTLASMLSPVLLISRAEGFGATLPTLDDAPPAAAALARRLRATRAGAHAMAMFAAQRHPPNAS